MKISEIANEIERNALRIGKRKIDGNRLVVIFIAATFICALNLASAFPAVFCLISYSFVTDPANLVLSATLSIVELSNSSCIILPCSSCFSKVR